MAVRILVVDDEPDLEMLVRQWFRRRIRDRELDFTFAADGVEALERLAADPELEIVLTDIVMPRMNGLTLLSRIRELDRLLKVVVVSAYGDMRSIRTAMNRGAFDFITKPVDLEDLEATIDKTRGELGLLRSALHTQKQYSALQRELELASQIQLSALPRTFPAFPGRTEFDLYATTIPAQEVGGDFYDFFLIDDDRLGFVIGDVSGKGIGAAMLMAITQTILRATALQGLSAEACVCHINRVLHSGHGLSMFVTLIYGILDTRTGEVSYVNAGHNLPFIVRAGGAVTELEHTDGLALCLKHDHDYGARRVTLAPGDGLLLYTDGVTEAMNDAAEEFTAERLRSTLAQRGACPPAEMVRNVFRALDAFSGGAAQSDDLTLLALQYRGAGG